MRSVAADGALEPLCHLHKTVLLFGSAAFLYPRKPGTRLVDSRTSFNAMCRCRRFQEKMLDRRMKLLAKEDCRRGRHHGSVDRRHDMIVKLSRDSEQKPKAPN